MSRCLCVLMIIRMVLSYRVRARNTSADSENKIHEDATAASFGFRGGLVPGVTVYAYMTVPIVERFGLDWLERGSMQVKFHQPFYDGEDVIVRAEVDAGGRSDQDRDYRRARRRCSLRYRARDGERSIRVAWRGEIGRLSRSAFASHRSEASSIAESCWFLALFWER